MIQASDFLDALKQRGFGMVTGVPCSFLKPLINYIIDSPEIPYFLAASEGDAIAMASGAAMTGVKSLVMIQNSGLGNTINPLTSLNHTFKIPLLLIATLRGDPKLTDQPQHELMGRVTSELLTTCAVTNESFPNTKEQIGQVLDNAVKHMDETSLPYGLIMHKGDVEKYDLSDSGEPTPFLKGEVSGSFTKTTMLRREAIAIIHENLSKNTALIATTGKTGRELWAYNDTPNQLYMVGSMGCAPALTLGVKLAQPERKVAVIDGDGALMMKMGSLTTIGYYRPKGYLHILIDNNSYESTGGQLTASQTVDFATIACSCGYEKAVKLDTPEQLEKCIKEWDPNSGPTLLHIRTLPGSDPKLPRPTITPPEVHERFANFLQTTDPAKA